MVLNWPPIKFSNYEHGWETTRNGKNFPLHFLLNFYILDAIQQGNSNLNLLIEKMQDLAFISIHNTIYSKLYYVN